MCTMESDEEHDLEEQGGLLQTTARVASNLLEGIQGWMRYFSLYSKVGAAKEELLRQQREAGYMSEDEQYSDGEDVVDSDDSWPAEMVYDYDHDGSDSDLDDVQFSNSTPLDYTGPGDATPDNIDIAELPV